MHRFAPALVLAAGLLAAGAVSDAGAAPRALVEASTIDLGDVPRGEVVEARFVVRNEGDELLRILRVKPG